MQGMIDTIKQSLKRKGNAHEGEISFRPLAALTIVAVVSRIFCLIVIDLPGTQNAGWLSVLIGALFAFPANMLCVLSLKRHSFPFTNGAGYALGDRGLRILSGILALYLTFETASIFSLLTSSGAYATLYNMHKLLLLVPTALAILLAAMKGGNGIGGAAEVWIRVYVILYAVILFFENGTMKISYAFPLLGPGLATLLNAALSVSGYFCLIPVSMMIGTGMIVKGRNDEKRAEPINVLMIFLISAVLSVMILFLHSCMYPSLMNINASRAMQMDMFISNGRSTRSVQLPILIIWFSCLLLSGGYMLYSAGKLMNTALNEKGRKCTFLLGMIALVLALFRATNQTSFLLFSRCAGVCLMLLITSTALVSLLKGGGKS